MGDPPPLPGAMPSPDARVMGAAGANPHSLTWAPAFMGLPNSQSTTWVPFSFLGLQLSFSCPYGVHTHGGGGDTSWTPSLHQQPQGPVWSKGRA